jgi:hypothetical protein
MSSGESTREDPTMTDQTPHPEGTPPAPPEPAAADPAAATPAATPPTATPPAATPPSAADAPDEAPTTEHQPFTYEDALRQAGDEDDVTPAPAAAAAPPLPDADATQANPVTAAAPVAPVAAPPVAAAPVAATAEPERPAGIFIPKWVGLVAAAIVAALVFGGIGYAIGDSDSGSSQSASVNAPNGRGGTQFPGGGQFPNFPGNGNQNGNGNGNGNQNGSGSGNQGGSGSGNQGGSNPAGDTAFMGVGVANSQDGKGVSVTEVASGSPAEKAGLKQGDVITSIDGTNVTTADALRSAIQAKNSGDQITVTYTRSGQSATAKVTLTSRSQAQSS